MQAATSSSLPVILSAASAKASGDVGRGSGRVNYFKDRIEQIVALATAEGQRRKHQSRYTEGTIHSHIKFRSSRPRGKNRRNRLGELGRIGRSTSRHLITQFNAEKILVQLDNMKENDDRR